MSRVDADLSWELITGEGVVRVRTDGPEPAERWGLGDPAGSGPNHGDPFDDDLLDADLF
jgi:hypothetical protein